MDRISPLLGRQALHARVFYNGGFCGANEFVEDGKAGHLHVVRSGCVVFEHEQGPPLQVEQPTVAYYPRGMSHRLVVPGKEAQLLCAAISFDGGVANPLIRALPDFFHVPLAQAPRLGQTLDLLFGEAGGGGAGQDIILDRLCDVLIVQMLRHELASGRLSSGMLAGLADGGLARALSAVHEQPQAAWRLETLAALAGMSRSKFAAHFHRVVGQTPGDYVTDRRLQLAKELLMRGKPVKSVSVESGYSSQPVFSRAFAERTGMSPRAWLRLQAVG
ncbi:transcriptional regulator, AraC family [Noviherbaspirillum humi]|uniref:Transcriptional regulator, AraC family n=1 Tax=Noviherbaspirillum humi TaxID=1688639 RepID=A0A239LB68_9BURK|nr:AraC family transcriptional regulator [Noviherbaspirillum humi]SNT27887.1 transcriptional regulator, AraC family [Noviherbaspirillum humi]